MSEHQQNQKQQPSGNDLQITTEQQQQNKQQQTDRILVTEQQQKQQPKRASTKIPKSKNECEVIPF
jgi:hypothetical protein